MTRAIFIGDNVSYFIPLGKYKQKRNGEIYLRTSTSRRVRIQRPYVINTIHASFPSNGVLSHASGTYTIQKSRFVFQSVPKNDRLPCIERV